MNGLVRIGEVSQKYDVSGRTLRYYEEMGLLKSIRDDNSQYRYYDDAAINRLETILLLKKLQLPIKDIRSILASHDLQTAVSAFTRKLMLLKQEIVEMEQLKEALEALLMLMKEKGFNSSDGLALLEQNPLVLNLTGSDRLSKHKIEKERSAVNSYGVKKLTDSDVRIIELKPMRVAYFRAESPSPEMDAWNNMMRWAEDKGLTRLSTTRYFGFNNPGPTEGNPIYGYEVWVTAADNAEVPEGMEVKEFQGGLYAVTSTFLYEITERWRALAEWVDTSDYRMGSHQWLEENISPIDTWGTGKTQIDLYCPIEDKN